MDTRSAAGDYGGVHHRIKEANVDVSKEFSTSGSSTPPEENVCWVQCENPNCLKWRIIDRKQAEILDAEAPWFCHMSSDIFHSSCDDPEEKFSTSKIKRHGLTYRYSLLPEGSIVWAKLHGYCKWPSILCNSPSMSEYVILDNDGDPHSYHVEFLGTKHSIAWVHHEKITAYGNLGKSEALETCSQPFSQVSMNRFKFTTKKRSRKGFKAKKKIRLSEQLQKAIDEADELIVLEREDILKSCQYRYSANPYTLEEKAREKGIEANLKRKIPERAEVLSNSQQSNHAIDNKLSDFRTKEDRLLADIQGLREKENEFMEDYSKFMERNRMTIKTPQWRGVSVGLFQLYLTVQERGGFNEVCANSKWKEIVMECCEMSTSKMNSSAAATAMSFYSRKMLPYEIYERSSRPKKDLSENQHAVVTTTAVTQQNMEEARTPSAPEAVPAHVIDGIFAHEHPQSLKEHEPLNDFEEMGVLLDDSNGECDEVVKNAEVTNTASNHRDVVRTPLQMDPQLPPSNNDAVSDTKEDMDSEDLFAEITRDEEFLQSFLSAS